MTDDDLHDRLRAAERLRDDAATAAGDLATVAAALRQHDEADLLTGAADRIRSARFVLMLLGRFNAGKSTLANALLGPAAGRVLPTGDEPTTPMLVGVEYAAEPFAEVTAADGTVRRWSVDEFRSRLVLDSDERVNRERFGGLVSARIGVPAPLLATGVVLQDTAGTSDTPERDAITLDALHRCDAAIVVHSLHSPYGHLEVADELRARGQHLRVFTVVNTFGKEVTDSKRRHAWNKLVLPRTGEPYRGQDLAGEDIHFIDAAPAGHDRRLLAALETSLGRFLATDRQAHHIARHTHLALARAEPLRTELTRLENREHVSLAAAAAERHRLDDELRDIAQRRELLLDRIRRVEREVRGELEVAFSQIMGQIQAELPGILRRAVLPSWTDGWRGRAQNLMFRDRIATELAAAAQERAVERLEAWYAEHQASIMARLAAVADETDMSLRRLTTAYDRAFHSLGRWQPGPSHPWAGTVTIPASVKVGAAVIGTAAVIAPVVVLPLVLTAAAITAAVTRDNLITVFLHAGWRDMSKRLEIYKTELITITEAAFATLRADTERVINDVSLIEAAQTGEARAALAVTEKAHRARLAELEAYRYRVELSAVSLRKVLEAVDG